MRPSRRPPPPLPLTILTGFLGAGKTTLLNRILKAGALADTLVLVNEFGDVGLDHLLIEAVESDLILLPSGCICCTMQGELLSALENIIRRYDNGRLGAIKRVVLETTGLADPLPILRALLEHPYLSLRFCLSNVVTVIDGGMVADVVARYRESVRQIALADALIVTKTDVNGPLLPSQIALLRQLNRAAPFFDAGAPDFQFLRLLDPAETMQRQKMAEFDELSDPIHAPQVHSHVIVEQQPIKSLRLEDFLNRLRTLYGAQLLRVKGLVHIAGTTGAVLIQGVQQSFQPPQILPDWPQDDRRTRLVFIVDGLPNTCIDELWAICLGRIGVDRPDKTALDDNPLAPRRTGLFQSY